MNAHTSPPGPVQYLTFYLCGQEYGVELLRVREVIESTAMTPVPSMPACVRGVINLRGAVVPVIDLALTIGCGETRLTKGACLLIMELGKDSELELAGVLADAIGQVFEFLDSEIASPPPFGTSIRPEHLSGMGKSGTRFVMLLDIDRVLAIEELLYGSCSQREAALGGASAYLKQPEGAQSI